MKIVLAIDGSKFSEAAAQAVITQGRPDEYRNSSIACRGTAIAIGSPGDE